MYVDVDANTDPFNAKMRGMQSVLKDTEKEVNNAGSAIKEMMQQAAMFGGISLGAAGVKEFASSIVKVRGEYQKLNASFTTMLGNKEKADALMKEMINTASTTPFQLSEVANGAKQLLAFNVAAEDINKTLIMLGDIASGLSMPLNDLTYLYGTTMAQGRMYTQDLNQFTSRGIPMISELAKLFGVAENEVKGLVEAGRVGFPEVQKVLENLTAEGSKFGGGMAAASKTIAGQISNLEDSIEQMFNQIGEANEGFISDTISGVAALVENYEKIGKIIAALIATYGTYKAAVMAVNAVETIRILGMKDAIRWMMMEVSATKAATIAQTAFNAVAKANPYVLLATAIIGVVGAVWALSNNTDKAADSQERLNRARDKFKKSLEDEAEEINRLIGVIQNQSSTDAEREAAYAKLKGMSAAITNQYTLEELQVAKLTDAQRLLNEEQQKKSVKNATGQIVDREEALQYLDEVEAYLKKAEQGKASSQGPVKSQKVQEVLNILGITYLNKEGIAEAKKVIQASIDALHKEVDPIIEGQRTAATKAANQSTYSADAKAAMNAWKEAKKKYDEIIKDQKATAKQVEEARQALSTADTKYENVTGKKASEVVKDYAKEAKERREAKEKVAKLTADQARENERAARDNAFAEKQAEIDGLKEGAEKVMRQRTLDHEKQLDQINRDKEDAVRAAKESARAIWEADRANQNKTWTDNLLKGNTGYEQAVANAEQKARIQQEQENYKFFDVSGLLAQYQDYDAQRRAIDDKYAADRAKLEEGLKNAQENGNMEMVANIQSSLKQLDISKSKELMQQSLDKLKADPAFIEAFQDLKNVSTETLNALYEELAKNKEALANLDPEQLKVMTDLMSQMQDEVLSRADVFTQYKTAVEELKAAELSKAQVDQRVINLQNALALAEQKFGKGSKEAVKAQNNLTIALKQQLTASDEVVKANNNVKTAYDKVTKETDNLVASIRNVGDAIGGEAGDITNFIANIYDFTMNSIDSVKNMSEGASKAMQAAERASVILLIIQAAIQVFQKLNEILNKFGDAAAYDKAVEKQKAINKLTDAVNEYTLAMMKANDEENSWFGDDAVGKLKLNADNMAQAMSNYYDKLYQTQVKYRNKSKNDDNWTVTASKIIGWTTAGAGLSNMANGKFGLNAYSNYNDYDAQYTSALNNLRIETKAKKKSFFGIGGHDQQTQDLRTWAKQQFGDDLFDADGWINGTLATQIIDSYGDKLQGETKDTLEQLMSIKEQYDEYMNQLKDYVGQMYQPIVENFTQSIMDWLDTGKDALNSFREYAGDVFRDIVKDMLNTIVLKQIVGTFQDDILDMYKQYSDGNMTESDLLKQVSIRTNEMVDTYEQQIPVLQSIATNMQDVLMETAGINIKDTGSTSATSGMAASFTQDSIDEANGRMASLQMGQQAQIEAVTAIASSVSAFVYSVADSNVVLSDLRDMAGIRNSMLTDMYDRMGVMQKTISEKLTTIVENTNNM